MASRIDSMSPEACRAYYAKIRSRSEARSAAIFNTAVAKALDPITAERDATPQEWVKAARAVRFPCGRCAGTGRFITGSLNGQPTGPGGDCFRCNGTGAQDDHDVRRNEEHDKHYIARHAFA